MRGSTLLHYLQNIVIVLAFALFQIMLIGVRMTLTILMPFIALFVMLPMMAGTVGGVLFGIYFLLVHSWTDAFGAFSILILSVPVLVLCGLMADWLNLEIFPPRCRY
jgi:hypothetical protein